MADNDKDNKSDDQAAIDAVLVEVDFPATRDDLVEAAQDADADETIVVWFQSLPEQEYSSREDVNRAGGDKGGGQSSPG